MASSSHPDLLPHPSQPGLGLLRKSRCTLVHTVPHTLEAILVDRLTQLLNEPETVSDLTSHSEVPSSSSSHTSSSHSSSSHSSSSPHHIFRKQLQTGKTASGKPITTLFAFSLHLATAPAKTNSDAATEIAINTVNPDDVRRRLEALHLELHDLKYAVDDAEESGRGGHSLRAAELVTKIAKGQETIERLETTLAFLNNSPLTRTPTLAPTDITGRITLEPSTFGTTQVTLSLTIAVSSPPHTSSMSTSGTLINLLATTPKQPPKHNMTLSEPLATVEEQQKERRAAPIAEMEVPENAKTNWVRGGESDCATSARTEMFPRKAEEREEPAASENGRSN